MAASQHLRVAAGSIDEDRRLAAVRRYDILDTPPDGSFDRVTAIAARLFQVPISIISLVDHDRIWFKSHHGLEVEQIPRGPGLCASAILQSDAWVLTDASTDVRSLANPLVAGEFGLRFYVGVPLRTHDGHNLGTLCVIDRQPRPVTEEQIEHLKDLASVVMDQMELRLSARGAIGELSQEAAAKDAALARAEMMAKEIDHRVMNSLQLVSSLLTLQSRDLGDSEAAAELRLAAARVTAVARVHQNLYLSEGAAGIDCRAYLQRLCDDLGNIVMAEKGAGLTVEAAETWLPSDRIAALGLIVNELVTNAAKHGAGRIAVSFARAGDGFALTVSDDGPGLPDNFDPAASRGLGMKVVTALARQLDGTLAFGRAEGGRGATFTAAFG
jgi:two-component sensor histidine kinase